MPSNIRVKREVGNERVGVVGAGDVVRAGDAVRARDATGGSILPGGSLRSLVMLEVQ
jgi:hypothetical protein